MANQIEMCFQNQAAVTSLQNPDRMEPQQALQPQPQQPLSQPLHPLLPTSDGNKPSFSNQEVMDMNDMTAVYDSEYGEDDDEESIFTDSRLLLSLTRLCKFVVIGFPTIIVLIIIFGTTDGTNAIEPNHQRESVRFRISQVFVSFGIIVLIVILCLSLFRSAGLRNFSLFRNPSDEENLNRMDERQRHREELKLQIKDPWRRKQSHSTRKPYFHHVDLYKQTGLYSNKHRY